MFNPAQSIRTRFAPSPTGFVHIGSLRTALFAFLFARHNKGINILRVEDTDQNRFVEGALENMLSVFSKVGIDFDEGPYVENGVIRQKGGSGPYVQSERKAQGIYQKHAEQLITEGKAYYCFCSEQRLEDLRKEQTALKKPPMYDRHCRNLAPGEIQRQISEFKAGGKNPVIRFAMPLEGETKIHDIIYGDITYPNKVLDDQIILKSDGFPTYHLAVVVDDHFMRITHVIRGEEWIPSTPKHLLIYRAFGWQPTEFAHLPLIVNPDRTKLSKRQGDVAVEDFLKNGYLKEALLNFIAFLGWNPKTEKEIFSLEELISEFELSNINNSNAVLDLNKLDWINSLYIRAKSDDILTDELIPYWQQAGVDTGKFKKDYLIAITALEKERLKKLSEIGERTRYFFSRPDYDPPLLVWKKSDKDKTRQALSDLHDVLTAADQSIFTKSGLEELIKKMIADKAYDNGSVLWPLRASLTGLDKSPGPFEVASTLALGLGKDEVLERIKIGINKLS